MASVNFIFFDLDSDTTNMRDHFTGGVSGEGIAEEALIEKPTEVLVVVTEFEDRPK